MHDSDRDGKVREVTAGNAAIVVSRGQFVQANASASEPEVSVISDVRKGKEYSVVTLTQPLQVNETLATDNEVSKGKLAKAPSAPQFVHESDNWRVIELVPAWLSPHRAICSRLGKMPIAFNEGQ